jgi:hypothetical protein
MAKKTAQTLGRNVVATVVGDTLTIEIDLSAATEPSGSGKTLIVASTEGNKKVNDDWVLGLNCYKYATARKKK